MTILQPVIQERIVLGAFRPRSHVQQNRLPPALPSAMHSTYWQVARDAQDVALKVLAEYPRQLLLLSEDPRMLGQSGSRECRENPARPAPHPDAQVYEPPADVHWVAGHSIRTAGHQGVRVFQVE